MSLLDGSSRKQLYQAILDAFPTYEDLKQLLSFQLNVSLEAITRSKKISEAILEVIEWAESKGKLSEFIHGAREENATNPALYSFEKQVWLPLLDNLKASQNARPTLSETKTIDAETGENVLKKQLEEPEDIIVPEPITPASSPMLPPQKPSSSNTSFPQNNIFQEHIIEVRNLIVSKFAIIQATQDVFQNNKSIYEDQRQWACDNIRDVVMEVQQLPTKLAHIPIMNTALRYLLYSEKDTLIVESELVKSIIDGFPEATSLRVRQDIQSKLDLLMKGLQEIDRLIGEFSNQIEQNGNDSQFDRPKEEQ